MYCAAKCGHVEAVETLIKLGANIRAGDIVSMENTWVDGRALYDIRFVSRKNGLLYIVLPEMVMRQ